MSALVDIARREVQRALSQVRQAFRAVTSSTIKRRTTAPSLVTLAGLGDQPIPNAEVMQHAGLAAGLPEGTPVVVLPVGGSGTHSLVIASDVGAHRVDVAVGEMALHHLTEPDCYLWLKNGRVAGLRGRVIVLQADEEVVMDTPQTRHTGNTKTAGDANVTGTVNADVDVIAAGVSGKNHHHNETGSRTNPPS